MPIGRDWIGATRIKRRRVARVLIERRDARRINIVLEQLHLQLCLNSRYAAVAVPVLAAGAPIGTQMLAKLL